MFTLNNQGESLLNLAVPIIVQARCASSRLPGKVLRNFNGDRSLLEFQILRLKKAFPDSPVVIATSISGDDQPVEDIAIKCNVYCFRGSEQDVLGRFVDCCRQYKFVDYIARVCADNPFLQTDWLKVLMRVPQEARQAPDYISHSINGQPAIRTHFGFFAEIIKVDVLEKIAQTATDPLYREHVTNYIYRDQAGGAFNIAWQPLSDLGAYVDVIRLTIDSQEDLDNAQTVYQHLKPVNIENNVSWTDLLSFIEQNPAVKSSMGKQIQLNKK